MEKENKNRIGLIVLLIAIVLFAGGITFAFFRADVTGTQEKLTVQTGTLALTFSDNNTGITKSQLQLGESTTKEFKIENTGTEDVTTNMIWNNLINTYTEGSLTYKFEYSTNETGPWTSVPNASGNIPQSESASDENLAEDITIPAHTTYYYQLTITLNHLTDVDQTADKNAVLSSNFKLGDKIEYNTETTLAALNITTKGEKPSFLTPAVTDETKDGLYAIEDNYGTSYYYRGAVENNYVKFGKWNNDIYIGKYSATDNRSKVYYSVSECQNASEYNYECTRISNAGKDMWWRIIRVNGDGSLRMIYDGTVAHKNGEGVYPFTITGVDGFTQETDRFINEGSTMVFNSERNDNAYVGYMFGSTGQSGANAYTNTHTNTNNSTVKTVIDIWYKKNIYDGGLNKYIADVVYCNDRSTPGQSVTGDSWDTGLGYGINGTSYGARARFYAYNKTSQPQISCLQKNDAFTVDDTIIGNGALTYPVGLVTSDEIVIAGVAPGNNNRNYYLHKTSNRNYWTMSPGIWTTDDYATVYSEGDGHLSNVGVRSYSAVAPVISIKAEYAAKITGTGTANDPYIIPGV